MSRKKQIGKFQITSHESRVTSHESRVTSHESRVTSHEYSSVWPGLNAEQSTI